MNYYVKEPAVEMRESACRDSKVVSQALFSEEVVVRETKGDWTYVSTPDGYFGWVLTNALLHRDTPYEGQAEVVQLKAHLYHVPDTEWGPIQSLPMGAKINVLDEQDPRWIRIALVDDSECYVQKGDVGQLARLQKEDLPRFSRRFLGLPYTWGGRSSFGYDCSGFVQMLYKQIGINLERDARQQINDPRLMPVDLSLLEAGDLIFFGKSAEKIGHVGMSLGGEEFIHTSVRENMPWVRISHLQDFEWSGNPDAFYPYRTARKLGVKK